MLRSFFPRSSRHAVKATPRLARPSSSARPPKEDSDDLSISSLQKDLEELDADWEVEDGSDSSDLKLSDLKSSESLSYHTLHTPELPGTPTQPLRPLLTHKELGDNFTEEQWSSALVHGRGIYTPHVHPIIHGVPVAAIQFRSYHPRLLDLFTHFTMHAAASLGIPATRPAMLPTQRRLWTVIRGPFVHKKSQENFERKVHKRAIKAFDAEPEVIDMWFKYLRQYMLAGVGMKTTRWERVPVGIGASMLKSVQDQLLVESTKVTSDKVKALGEKIIKQEMASLKVKPRKIVEPPRAESPPTSPLPPQ